MALLGGKEGRSGVAVSLPDWRDALERVVTDRERAVYVRAILGFLRHCKSVRAPATIRRAKAYIEAYEKQEDCRLEIVRAALRWFFRAAESRAKLEAGGGVTLRGAGQRCIYPYQREKGESEPTGTSALPGAETEVASREREPYGGPRKRFAHAVGGRV